MKVVLGSLMKPWNKALFLDYLLNEVHLGLIKKNKPDFTTIFLNAGAHIQHHYFHNSEFNETGASNPNWYIKSKYDPILDMLEIYDSIVGDYLNKNFFVVISTGLSQTPHDKTTFYYRLVNHNSFLEKFNINYHKIYPRMTRDFLVTFKDNVDRDQAAISFSNFFSISDNERVFNEIEVREKSLFVTLTYPNEIKNNMQFRYGDKIFKMSDHVVFVAIKNGEHSPIGFTLLPEDYTSDKHNDMHISSLFHLIDSYF
tara:strand:+ start:37 stop:804 length:768 start_codon:yes stop_codon:yes gene_type:complete